MKVARTAARPFRRLRARFSPGGVILLYHRIAPADSGRPDLSVRADRFEEHLRVIREEATPISLGELVRAAAEGRRTARSVAVTFDDGYRDNLHEALPRLESAEVPATVFVVSGNLGREFWWDRYERLRASKTAQATRLPASREMARMDHARRTGILDAARPEGDGGTAPRHRALSEAELCELARSPLISVGAHTVSHPPLDAVASSRRREEIHAGKAALEEIVGEPVTAFAYPHGALSRVVVDDVRRAGFDHACATHAGVVRAGTDPFRLPRLWVNDVEGEGLRRQLRAWLGDPK